MLMAETKIILQSNYPQLKRKKSKIWKYQNLRIIKLESTLVIVLSEFYYFVIKGQINYLVTPNPSKTLGVKEGGGVLREEEER